MQSFCFAFVLTASLHSFGQTTAYMDGGPVATKLLACTDAGVVRRDIGLALDSATC